MSRTEGVSPSRPTHVLLAAAGAVALAWLLVIVIWRNAPFSLTFDDAFYYFGIARNLAHGHGSTFDGIDATNGYHPLWMLLAALVYRTGIDGTPAVRLLLAVQAVCYGAALGLLAWTAGRAIGGWDRLRTKRPDDADRAARWCTGVVALGLVAVAGNPFVVKVFVNGMESGLLVLLDAAVLAVGAARRGRFLFAGAGRDRWLIGVLLSLTLLARTDGVLLLAVLGLWTLAEARSAPRAAIRPLIELFALPTLTLIGYLASNQIYFGLLEQISGLTKRAPLTVERLAVLVAVGLVASAFATWGFRRCHGRRQRSRFGRVAEFASSTSWFAAFAILMVAYYQVLQSQQWLWYYCPVAIYLMFLLVLAVADFAEGAMIEAPIERSPGRAVMPVAAILLVPLLLAGVYEGRQMADPHGYSIAIADRDAGQWISGHLRPGTVLGSWDAGVIGYYANRPVINLDGVANSYGYYQAGRQGTLGAWLRARHLAGTVNLGTPQDGQDPSAASFVRNTMGAAAAARMSLRMVWPLIYSGSTTGSAGSASGTRRLAVFLYELGASPTG